MGFLVVFWCVCVCLFLVLYLFNLFILFLSLLPSIFALSGKLKLLLIMCLHTGRCWRTHHHFAQPPLGKTIGKVLKLSCISVWVRSSLPGTELDPVCPENCHILVWTLLSACFSHSGPFCCGLSPADPQF